MCFLRITNRANPLFCIIMENMFPMCSRQGLIQSVAKLGILDG
jgi:hypothetical protein